MKIYFEDGILNPAYKYCFDQAPKDFGDQPADFIVYANGFRLTVQELDDIAIHYPEAIVYTNSICGLYSLYHWNDKEQIPELYVRDINGIFKRVDTLTNKTLRKDHDYIKLYCSGEFETKEKYREEKIWIVNT
jgi:hypothetical protein